MRTYLQGCPIKVELARKLNEVEKADNLLNAVHLHDALQPDQPATHVSVQASDYLAKTAHETEFEVQFIEEFCCG